MSSSENEPLPPGYGQVSKTQHTIAMILCILLLIALVCAAYLWRVEAVAIRAKIKCDCTEECKTMGFYSEAFYMEGEEEDALDPNKTAEDTEAILLWE